MSPSREELDERALELLHAGQHDKYRALMEKMVEEYPDDADVRLHWGTALSLTTPDEAAEQIQAAVELAPCDPVILTRAGSRLFELGEFEWSQECASGAGDLVKLSEFSLGSDLVHLAGRLAARQGDDERARTLLQAAVDVGPEDRCHARYAKALARFLAERGDAEAARETVSKALVDHPEDDELRQMAATDPPSRSNPG